MSWVPGTCCWPQKTPTRPGSSALPVPRSSGSPKGSGFLITSRSTMPIPSGHAPLRTVKAPCRVSVPGLHRPHWDPDRVIAPGGRVGTCAVPAGHAAVACGTPLRIGTHFGNTAPSSMSAMSPPRCTPCASTIAATAPALDLAARLAPHVPVTDPARYRANPWSALIDCTTARTVWRPAHHWPESRRGKP